MEGSTEALNPSPATGIARPWELVGRAIGSVSRWLFWGIVISGVPIVISLLTAPIGTSVADQLSHGDLAVMASAVAGGSVCELLGPEPPVNWLRNVLLAACVMTLLGSTILLMSIGGDSDTVVNGHLTHIAKLTKSAETKFSVYLLVIAITAGIPAMAPEIRRVRLTKSAASKPVSENNVHESESGDE